MTQMHTPTYTADDQLDLCRDWDQASCPAGREDAKPRVFARVSMERLRLGPDGVARRSGRRATVSILCS